MTDIIKFDMPEAAPSIIMVAGVGGGGSNAVNHMFHLGITDVSFMVCNTDMQALNRSQIPIKIVLGQSLTQGLGAGNKPEVGRAAAEESYDEIMDVFRKYSTKMVFVTAGMGGGTGTGAAPVIAKAAKELGILTIAIVTIPFKTEGRKGFNQALAGIEQIKKYVDSLLIINNENILEIHGKLILSEAFGMADDILAAAAKGIAEIITGDNYINVDFADVKTVMSDSGVALMGTGRAGGENRADDAVKAALTSPLLNHRDISGAKNILLNITSGNREVTLDETYHITNYVQEQTGYVADLIWGAGKDESLDDDIQVTIIATGFEMGSMDHFVNLSPFPDAKKAAVRSVPKPEEPATEAVGAVQTGEREASVAAVASEAQEPVTAGMGETDDRETAAFVSDREDEREAEEPLRAELPVAEAYASGTEDMPEEPREKPAPHPVSPFQRPGFAASQPGTGAAAGGKGGARSPFQPRQAVGRTTIVAANDSSEGYVVVEQNPAVYTSRNAEIPEETINYDELEKSPAWLRRKMAFSEATPSDDKVSRVTLKDDAGTGSARSRAAAEEQRKNALFD